MTSGPDFYDEEDVFATYVDRRRDSDTSPNDTIERPALMPILGDYQGKAILDLGCGDGGFGAELIAGGCQSYTGVEASSRMVALAQQALEPVGGTVHHATIEDWSYPQAAYDVVVSRLALHYVEDIVHVFARVQQSLKPAGRFIFSVEHPVLTSDNSAATESGIRYNWVVDNYFVGGKRNVDWMGSQVVKYHRTIEDYFTTLQEQHFTVEQLREPRPQPEMFTDEALFTRRQRIPLFLLLAARRNG